MVKKVGEKVTSIRIKEDIWKAAKVYSIEEDIPLKSLIEEALIMFIEGKKMVRNLEVNIREDIIRKLEMARKKGKLPFRIVSKKTAVEIVREGRGD